MYFKNLLRLLRVIVIGLFWVLGLNSCNDPNFSDTASANPLLDSIYGRLDQYKTVDLSQEEKIEYVSEALHWARTLNNDTTKRKIFLDVGAAYKKLGNSDLYRKNADETFLLSYNNGDSLGMAQSYYRLGTYHRESEHVDSAYQNYFRAERVFAALGDNLYAGRAQLAMAIIQKNAKDYVGGEASSVKAIEYLEPVNDLRFLSSAQSNLGLIAYEQGQYDRALDYHQRALASRKKLRNQSLVVSSLNNIGIVYQGKQQYGEAMKYYEEGLSYDSLFLQRPPTYARLLDNLAYAKFLSEEYDNLPDLFMRPLRIRDSLNENLGAVTSHLHLAEYYARIDSMDRAAEYARIAFEKAKPLNYHRGILESLELLTGSSSDEEALGYAKERIRISDSLQDQERAFRNQFARIRFETDELEIEKERVTRQKKQLTILSMSLAILFLLVYIFFQRQSNKKELRFQEAQQNANEEIYQLMLSQQTKFEEGKELEKTRISEELHDGILGKLFGIRLNLDSLNQKNSDQAISERTRYIEELKSIENEVRQISHDLNSSKFDSAEVYSEVIEKLVSDTAKIHQLEHEYTSDPSINWEEVPNHTKIHLYRILQEALQNVVKHADATVFKVVFTKGDGLIKLSVEDDGIGMNMIKKSKGIGLRNMRSRAHKMDGNLTIKSEKGEGTYVNLDAYL